MNTNAPKVFRARRVITPNGEVAASVVVRDGRIAEIVPFDAPDWAGLTDVVHWMATGPADLVGLNHKGRIAIGADADLCVFAPHEEFVVDATALQHRNPITAYDGRTLRGVVRSTWLRGEHITGDHPRGRLLQKGV
ncbi:amidohydrolase family protein [Nocardia wallacei]|uniref:amidohydrolase family protein n=1 Tax=Nocardia wallacei TaxID=480035 RepID=UPI00245753D3|nr:amidohydrolase family protein [Nocardia wallacei]